jgi:hypothetical protein
MNLSRLMLVLLLIILSLIAYESRYEHAYPLLNDIRTASGVWFSNFQHFSFGLVATFTTLFLVGDMVLPVSKKRDLNPVGKKLVVFGLASLPVLLWTGWWEFFYQADNLWAVDYLDVSFDFAGALAAMWTYKKYVFNIMTNISEKAGLAIFVFLDMPLFFVGLYFYTQYPSHPPLSVFI